MASVRPNPFPFFFSAFSRSLRGIQTSGSHSYWFAVGVGHDEDSPAEMRRTNGGCGYALPFCVVPDLGQVAEYVSHSLNKEPWHVFQQNSPGSKMAKASCDFGPEPSVVVLGSSPAG